MNANQIPYDQLDWLQIGVYFLALPIVAFLGASLGLIGRWRRGGVLWATNVGLLGGVAACLVCILAITTLDGKLPAEFLTYFEGTYRWQMLAAALGATCGCAVAAAIAWRITHERREVQPLSFSLAQLTLIQLFSLLSLGAWIGFRLLVLSAVSPGEYYNRAMNATIARWTTVGWDIDWQYRRRAEINFSDMQPNEIVDSLSVFNEKDLKMLPDLESISLKFSSDSDIDLAPLIEHGGIRSLGIEFGNISDRLLRQIAESKIESLGLIGDLSSRDLSVLAKAPKLKRLVIFGNSGPATMESLAACNSLKQLLIYDSNLSGTKSVPLNWPANLEELTIGSSEPTWDGSTQSLNRSLLERLPKLKSLNLYGSYLMEPEDILLLRTHSSIERLHIYIGSPSQSVVDAIVDLPLNQNENGYLALAIVDADFTADEAARLKSLKRLRWLSLQLAEHGDEVLSEIAQLPSIERVEINSPRVTLDGLRKLADAPKLDWLDYPAAINNDDFEKEFRAKRKSTIPTLTIDGNQKPVVRQSAKKGKP